MSTGLRRWLEERTPPALIALGPYLGDVGSSGEARRTEERTEDGGGSSEPLGELSRAAVEALGRVRSRPGRVRESAFVLLAADALITYACEAALEHDDAEAALEQLLQRVASR